MGSPFHKFNGRGTNCYQKQGTTKSHQNKNADKFYVWQKASFRISCSAHASLIPWSQCCFNGCRQKLMAFGLYFLFEVTIQTCSHKLTCNQLITFVVTWKKVFALTATSRFSRVRNNRYFGGWLVFRSRKSAATPWETVVSKRATWMVCPPSWSCQKQKFHRQQLRKGKTVLSYARLLLKGAWFQRDQFSDKPKGNHPRCVKFIFLCIWKTFGKTGNKAMQKLSLNTDDLHLAFLKEISTNSSTVPRNKLSSFSGFFTKASQDATKYTDAPFWVFFHGFLYSLACKNILRFCFAPLQSGNAWRTWWAHFYIHKRMHRRSREPAHLKCSVSHSGSHVYDAHMIPINFGNLWYNWTDSTCKTTKKNCALR